MSDFVTNWPSAWIREKLLSCFMISHLIQWHWRTEGRCNSVFSLPFFFFLSLSFAIFLAALTVKAWLTGPLFDCLRGWDQGVLCQRPDEDPAPGASESRTLSQITCNSETPLLKSISRPPLLVFLRQIRAAFQTAHYLLSSERARSHVGVKRKKRKEKKQADVYGAENGTQTALKTGCNSSAYQPPWLAFVIIFKWGHLRWTDHRGALLLHVSNKGWQRTRAPTSWSHNRGVYCLLHCLESHPAVKDAHGGHQGNHEGGQSGMSVGTVK